MFADDGLLYRDVHNMENTKRLQDDLDSLQTWERDWLMEFNPSKCEAITFTKKTKPVHTKYTLHDQTIAGTVSSARCLGVNINSELSWNTHIDTTAKKATQSLNFLRRNFSCCPTAIPEQCYKTLVRPQLEYASYVWQNPVRLNVGKVEAVQRSAARFTCCDFKRTSSVTAMLQKLQWDSLQQRRARSRVLMLYRIRNGLVAIPASAYLHPATTHTRGSETRYRQIQCNTNTYSHTFFPTAICLWSTLPVDVCQLPPPSRQLQSSTELSPADVNACWPRFILCIAPFLSVHRYDRLLPFAPLLSLHAPGPSHRGAILLNPSWHLSARRREGCRRYDV